ncbi:YkoP family protein [Deinococcus aquiradiocola]|uniref:YkoP-like domain-containing protein n=1 Tax=Deinococcus aquiradiocola TaxID=393059 RepID=A0A917UTN2_9DEIO|nr:hypothetical protein [Deinococcus aquiradiocola]GGJ84297.1 hypothetical protein GCM10008939_30220 [Deinococcus aquiradiocola]
MSASRHPLRVLTLPLLGVGTWLAWQLAVTAQSRAHFGVLREGQGGQVKIGLGVTLPAAPAAREALLAALDGTPVTLFVHTRDLSALQAHPRPGTPHELALGAPARHDLPRARHALQQRSPDRPVTLLRPDTYTPTTARRARHAQLRPVWRGPTGTPDDLLAAAEPGGLLNLDGLMPDQVRALTTELRARGYQPSPISDLNALRSETPRGLLQRLYRRTFDAHFDRQHHTLPLTQRPRALFRVSARPYDGPAIQRPEAPAIPPGTPAAELHIYSKRLVAIAELSALTGLRAVQTSLHDVAHTLETHPDYRDAQLVYALTIFAGVLGPLGFRSQPLPDRRQARVMAVFFNLLRILYGAKNAGEHVREPEIIWMTRSDLLNRYGSARTRRR